MRTAFVGASVLLVFVASDVSLGNVCRTENIPPVTPGVRFVVSASNKEVKDTLTRLAWQRCPLGMMWDAGKCIGVAKTYTWQQALQEAQALGNGWRLPNVKELSSIVERACQLPAINEDIFPGTPGAVFWAGTPAAARADSAWAVDFADGSSSYDKKTSYHYVRLVKDAE